MSEVRVLLDEGDGGTVYVSVAPVRGSGQAAVVRAAAEAFGYFVHSLPSDRPRRYPWEHRDTEFVADRFHGEPYICVRCENDEPTPHKPLWRKKDERRL